VQINEGVLLVLEDEVDDFKRKVPNCFIYLNEMPYRVIRSSVAPHGSSVIKAETERGIFQYQIHPLHSAVFINYRQGLGLFCDSVTITILVQTPLRGSNQFNNTEKAFINI